MPTSQHHLSLPPLIPRILVREPPTADMNKLHGPITVRNIICNLGQELSAILSECKEALQTLPSQVSLEIAEKFSVRYWEWSVRVARLLGEPSWILALSSNAEREMKALSLISCTSERSYIYRMLHLLEKVRVELLCTHSKPEEVPAEMGRYLIMLIRDEKSRHEYHTLQDIGREQVGYFLAIYAWNEADGDIHDLDDHIREAILGCLNPSTDEE